MGLGFRKFISEVFVNGKFLKILPSENFLLYGICTYHAPRVTKIILAGCAVSNIDSNTTWPPEI